MGYLLHELILDSAELSPQALALRYQERDLSYARLAERVRAAAAAFVALGLGRGERLAVYLEKRLETVTALYGACAAGAVFVPVNPLLKPEQVVYILNDCNVRMLVTSPERLAGLVSALASCHDLHTVLVTGDAAAAAEIPGLRVLSWENVLGSGGGRTPHRVIDSDMAAILYTSGSTGKPKGVVLSHRNLVAGAKAVARYLENHPEDRILSVLPLSFDYGLNQLSTAFLMGAAAVLMNYLLPRDVIAVVARERITGLAAVPPLWIQLAELEWPSSVREHVRYLTNSGGRMPLATLKALRERLPKTQVFLMYGLTEAFRSTYLPPSELDRRPESIGKAIPNAEVLVVREDGTPCAPGEPGELVHRGVLVSMGYWNDPVKTAERFKLVPVQERGLTIPELAVWSGDTVRIDEEGYLYFVSRRDEMIKTSGYRVSPTEVEEVVYATGLVSEVAVIGIPHPVLGQAIVVVATAKDGDLQTDRLLAECKQRLPAFMMPALIQRREGNLPRNPNGKIDRKLLAQELRDIFPESTQ
jgi:acyl-CoA ligase (AMP-forming) (exosortase A-associated)